MWPAVISPRATGRKHLWVVFFVLVCFSPLPQYCLLVLSETAVATGWPELGFSCFPHCLQLRAFRPGECVGKPISSQPCHREPFGIAPTRKTSCWQPQGVTSAAFPRVSSQWLGTSLCQTGSADGAGGQTSQPRILRNGERSSLLSFVGHWLSYGCPSSPTLFLWFSLLFS